LKGLKKGIALLLAVGSFSAVSPLRAEEITSSYATNTTPTYFDVTTKEPLPERVRFFKIHEYLTGYFFRRLEDKGNCGGSLCEEQGIGETLAMSLALAGGSQDPQYTIQLAKLCITVNNSQCVEKSLNDALVLIDNYEPTTDLTTVPSEPIDLTSVTSAFNVAQYAGSSLEEEPWTALMVYSEMLNAGTDIPHFKLDRAIAAMESLRYSESPSLDGVSLKELAKQDIGAVLQGEY
jgi:hypothetical protein